MVAISISKYDMNMQDWQSINLTDIQISVTKFLDEGSEQHKYRNITLKFQSDVARDWKVRFDREKHRCSAIAHLKKMDSEQSTSM